MLQGDKIGPFTIVRELGSGAMGSVYLADFAKDDGSSQKVALKIVALGLLGNESALARFDREASILKQLKHPHIVRLIATGRYRKTPFIAMEFVDGDPIDKILTRQGRIAWETVVDYAKQLCDALQYAHEKGIIHRDLKPSNLMLTKDGVLKLTDFGIAKDTDVTALTGANSTIGTAAYMSPEQCKGDKFISNKSDLYSLGIVLYELITGRKPYVAENTVDMFLKHVNETPVRPAKIVSEVPVWLDNLIMFLLEKDKERRPMDAATVGRMLADIEQKVQSQQSAGVVAVEAKRSSRTLMGQTFDSEDKDAARALKGKRKKKKKGAAWYTAPWVKAVPLLLGVVLIVGGIGYAVKNAGGGGGQRRGGGGEVMTAEERDGHEWEKVLQNRYRSGLFLNGDGSEDKETYAQTIKAMEREKEGNLKMAADLWEDVAKKLESITGETVNAWKWVAQKRIKDLASVDAKRAELEAKLTQDQIDERIWKHDSIDPHSNAYLALRYEQFGDIPRAKKLWTLVAKDLDKKLDEWPLYLLARRQSVQESSIKPGEEAKVTLENLASKMKIITEFCKRTDELKENGAKRRTARNACRDVIELYGEESGDEYKKAVEEAKRLFEEVKKLDI
ncbi:MAG: protein kinase [Gemmataceae bacterium]